MPKIYHDRKEQTGSASLATVNLTRIPEGYQLHVKLFTATIYTTNVGDYGTQKYILLGYDQNGVKFYVSCHRINAGYGTNPLAVCAHDFYIPENAFPFATFEATTTSQKYLIAINGILKKISK